MSYYPRGYNCGDKVDDFDDYDPSPYSGGYDMNLNYGRPLSASHDTCYPRSTSSSSSHDKPTGYSGSHPSAYSAHDEDELNIHSSHVHRPHLIDRPHGHGNPTGYGNKGDGGGGDDDDRYSHTRKNESEGYGGPPSYGRHGKPSYKKHDDEDGPPSYGRHGKPSYKNHDDEDDNNNCHDRPRYGRNKHGDAGNSSNEDDDDDDERRHRRHGHQHRSYDDE